jgi:hypothetical protein
LEAAEKLCFVLLKGAASAVPKKLCLYIAALAEVRYLPSIDLSHLFSPTNKSEKMQVLLDS